MARGEETAEEGASTRGRTITWWARFYDAVTWAMSFGREPAIRRRTVALAGLSAGEKVLDVGCGTGTLALAAAAKVGPEGEITGIDASPQMIEIARKKARRQGVAATFEVAPVEALPFADGSFDAVLSSFMLHHLPDDLKRQGFAEIYRVLKPGARFLAVDLADKSRSFIGRAMGLMGHAMPKGYVQGLLEGLRAAGFEDAREEDGGFRYLAFLRAAKGGAP